MKQAQERKKNEAKQEGVKASGVLVWGRDDLYIQYT